MKAYSSIPENYTEIASIDLQKDKRTSTFLTISSLLIMLVMTFVMALFRPIGALFDMSEGLLPYTSRFVVLILGYVAYIVLHELTHACAMRLLGGREVKFGFTGMYAYAGSEVDYFDRNAYICIALAPLTVWFLVLFLLGSFLPPAWFWVVYLLQIGNVAGSVGDVYVVFRVLQLPDHLFVQDSGVSMKIYAAQKPGTENK